MRISNPSEHNIDLLIKSFIDAGATITKGTGKLFVNGQETDIITALKEGFCDFENKELKGNREYRASVSVDLKKIEKDTVFETSEQQIFAA